MIVSNEKFGSIMPCIPFANQAACSFGIGALLGKIFEQLLELGFNFIKHVSSIVKNRVIENRAFRKDL
jgi:hypothetical protein